MIEGYLILSGVAGLAAGFLLGRAAEREELYRRFWTQPIRTMETIRTEARRRYL